MAIGSEGEIGVVFSRWGDMTESDRAAWFEHVRSHWGPDLLGGYGTLCVPDWELFQLYRNSRCPLL